MSDKSIREIWSHYGDDATGGGKSELEILVGIEADIEADRLADAREKFEVLGAVSRSFGYGEADGFLSDGHDPETDEGRAHIDSYENLWETDYADTIDATENYVFDKVSDPVGRAIAAEAIRHMRDGYEAGRRMREDRSEPRMGM